jgi:hypothetical protein
MSTVELKGGRRRAISKNANFATRSRCHIYGGGCLNYTAVRRGVMPLFGIADNFVKLKMFSEIARRLRKLGLFQGRAFLRACFDLEKDT